MANLEAADKKVESDKASSTTKCEDNQLDEIIVQIGQFGRFQISNYVLLCLPIICNAFYSISYVFTASPVPHRCLISQCDSPQSSFEANWLNFTTPHIDDHWSECEHYAASNKAICAANNFRRNKLVGCESGYKLMGDEQTIANEFNLFCSEAWKLNWVGTVNNIGQFVGIPLGGLLADRYGRKTILVLSGVLSAFAGLARSHCDSYNLFLFFEFLDMAVGSTLFPTGFLLAIELVGPQRRVIAATVVSLTYGLAEAGLGYLAQYIRDWRLLLRVLYTPALLHLLFICLLPESVRWLLSQSREEEAKLILSKAARVNGKELAEAQLNELILKNRKLVEQSGTNGNHYSLMEIVNSLGVRIALCCIVWFTNTFVSLGLSLNVTTLSGNKFENFAMTGFMQVPGILLGTLLMHHIGRRYALCLAHGSCGFFLIASVILTTVFQVQPIWTSILYFLAKMGSTMSFMILYFFTSEIFPTNSRNSLLSFCSMVGRFGSMLAPQTPLLAKYYKHLPSLVFAATGLLCAVLTLSFPETTDKVLPTTLEEARALDKSMPQRPGKSTKNMFCKGCAAVLEK